VNGQWRAGFREAGFSGVIRPARERLTGGKRISQELSNLPPRKSIPG
jgi:hypothetical protein